MNTVSQTVKIPEQSSFITAGVKFNILPGMLSAKINVMEEAVEQDELAAEPISIDVGISDNFQILLGVRKEEDAAEGRPLITALWDEFALYNAPPMDIIAAEVKKPVFTDSETDDSSPN